MPSGPRRGTSPPLQAPSASPWAAPDATHPCTVSPLSVAPPSSPLAPASSPHSHPSPAAHPLTFCVSAHQQTTVPPPPPPSSNPYLTHPLVASGRISADLAHLLAEINYARNTGRVRRNTSKARVLTAQEMSGVIEEAEDRACKGRGPSSGQKRSGAAAG
ncbi:merozoite surface protein CMZ-8-like [Mastacembelus armatus]|uniref:merozoite surface protein CMZ-8-like n=1 Tax=Mastacembelus armatus TaxID=205130 RepID=UPI000E456E51|nr:merozoite surface protein CMZ-8-like [Mastacembelus armatus]